MKVTELKENEMENIIGGSLPSSFINAIAKAVSTLYDLGKETGSAIRRLTSGKYCAIN